MPICQLRASKSGLTSLHCLQLFCIQRVAWKRGACGQATDDEIFGKKIVRVRKTNRFFDVCMYLKWWQYDINIFRWSWIWHDAFWYAMTLSLIIMHLFSTPYLGHIYIISQWKDEKNNSAMARSKASLCVSYPLQAAGILSFQCCFDLMRIFVGKFWDDFDTVRIFGSQIPKQKGR